MSADFLGPYQVSAFNTAHDSDNKIHDDTVARRFGFGGGLVPGVDVYGYMTHLPVLRWGRNWLERGSAECRFLKPVYDGDIATVTARDSGGELDIEVHSRGELCASGHAALPDTVPISPQLDEFHAVSQRAERPPADEASLAQGLWLGLDPYQITPETSRQHLADLRESATIYAEQSLIHPAMVLRACNFVLNRNVTFGPWVHTGSQIQHLATAAPGESLSARAHITKNYQHKGHSFVEIDALVLADERRAIARVTHTAIYRLRQAAAA